MQAILVQYGGRQAVYRYTLVARVFMSGSTPLAGQSWKCFLIGYGSHPPLQLSTAQAAPPARFLRVVKYRAVQQPACQ
jgi:hypothetical protein